MQNSPHFCFIYKTISKNKISISTVAGRKTFSLNVWIEILFYRTFNNSPFHQRVHHTISGEGRFPITAGAALMAGLLAAVIAGPG